MSRLDCVGTWLSLVEHSLGVRGVGSSNLPVPTIKINKLSRCFPRTIKPFRSLSMDRRKRLILFQHSGAGCNLPKDAYERRPMR